MFLVIFWETVHPLVKQEQGQVQMRGREHGWVGSPNLRHEHSTGGRRGILNGRRCLLRLLSYRFSGAKEPVIRGSRRTHHQGIA